MQMFRHKTYSEYLALIYFKVQARDLFNTKEIYWKCRKTPSFGKPATFEDTADAEQSPEARKARSGEAVQRMR